MIEVYYAEDDEIIAQSVKEYLEEKNCRVTTFGTLAALRSALKSRIPTILLLDWNMPDGQGSELCRWIRERRADLPIIFLTVRGDSHDIVSGFQYGADDYVVKPFALAVLHSRMLALLRRGREYRRIKTVLRRPCSGQRKNGSLPRAEGDTGKPAGISSAPAIAGE